MTKRRKKALRDKQRARRAAQQGTFQRQYDRAARLAAEGQHAQARELYATLEAKAPDQRRRALVRNDLAALAAADGDIETARRGFEGALAIDAECELARENLA